MELEEALRAGQSGGTVVAGAAAALVTTSTKDFSERCMIKNY
jgi:hypothetical protein